MSAWSEDLQPLFANGPWEPGMYPNAWDELLNDVFATRTGGPSMVKFGINETIYFVPTTLESAGTFHRFLVQARRRGAELPLMERKTALLIQIEPEHRLSSKYWRGMVDHELRSGMEEMRSEYPGTVIHGIAAFGWRIAIYSKTGENPIDPPRPPLDAQADLAPELLFDLDIRNVDGADRLKEVAEQVKAAFAASDATDKA
ncbi:hypothetical protein C8F04DRAFT_1278728 [Mycena alexandri]|uniref:Uncharacterized protein n=1 Tax=Mycena alexandri TaxID=1745969 RepID=A0AAD6RYJ8_9AGAR|nr:hypothetical protein C8F04DRAFT_1406898 [Mycena alexandri]KAJ7017824.1 hypothetical protein C8F04DRAFT_1278728 [Mycena alexandri]